MGAAATGSLAGRAAIVTGSTSGIGQAMAEALAAEGAAVMLNGFGEAAAIEDLRAGMAARFGVTVGYSPADMSKVAEVEGLVAATAAAMGSVDILINNAGVQFTAPVHEFPQERWDQILAINLTAAFVATKAALPGMLARGWGRILNVASAHGLVASPHKSAYVAAKHGLVGLTKVTALETATTPVTCNAICPGWVLTPLVQKQIDDRAAREGIPVERARHDLLAEKQPSLAFVTPAELAGLAVFLCSPSAAQIRGQAIAMDGGWTAQ
jgi:3-hydroxybutyrate dehydrogenase